MDFETFVGLVAWVGNYWVIDTVAIAKLESKEVCEIGRVETEEITSLT